MDKSKRNKSANPEAVVKARSRKQIGAKQPPIDMDKQWLAPIFTLEEAGRKYHLKRAPHAFPVDLLGNVAARLLVGHDYMEAVKRANLLLLACEAYNFHVTSERESLTKHVARLNQSDLPETMDFGRAVCVVTGQARMDRGLLFFCKLFEALYVYPNASDQNDHLEEMKERGFTKACVLDLKDRFAILRKTGQLSIRRAPKRKSLPRKTRSKRDTKGS